MKNITRYMGTLVVCLVLISVCIHPAYAAGFGGGERAGEFGSGGFGSTTVKTEISYDALSELCIVVNDQITQGLFEDVSPFCDTFDSLAATVRYDLDNGFYVISVKVGTTYYNLRNNSGGLYVAYENSDSLLAGIWGFLSRIDHAFTSEDGPFALWMELLDTDLNLVNLNLETIDLHIKQMLGYVETNANGMVTAVGLLEDLIEAVNGISISADGATINFDTLPITDKLEELVEAVNNLSVSTDPVGFGGGAIAGNFVLSEQCTTDAATMITFDALSELCIIVNDQISQGLYDNVSPFCDTDVPLSANLVGYQDFAAIAVEFDGTLYYLVNNSGGLYMATLPDYYYIVMLGNNINDIFRSENGPIGGISDKLESAVDSLLNIFAQLQYSGPADFGIWSPSTLYDYVMEGEKWLSMIASDTDFLSDIAIDTGDGLEALQSIQSGLNDLVDTVDCNHSYVSVVLMEPSCDLPGVTKYTCDYCSSFRIEPIAPLGHDWVDFAPEEPVALLEDVDLFLVPDSDPPMLSCRDVIELIPGDQYRVIYNGAEYLTECAMVNYSGMSVPALGNIDAFLGVGDNGCPFVLASAELLGGTGGFDFTGADSATVSIYTVPEETEEVPAYLQSLNICSRCDSGHNLSSLMTFLDERLVPGSGGSGGSIDVTPVVDKLTSIENALSNLGGDVDIENNTNIEVSEDNDSYNVFYVEDPDSGDDQSIVDLSGDALTVFGKLLNFLYQVGFKDALDGAGPGIGDLADFYLDNAEGSADLWAS